MQRRVYGSVLCRFFEVRAIPLAFLLLGLMAVHGLRAEDLPHQEPAVDEQPVAETPETSAAAEDATNTDSGNEAEQAVVPAPEDDSVSETGDGESSGDQPPAEGPSEPAAPGAEQDAAGSKSPSPPDELDPPGESIEPQVLAPDAPQAAAESPLTAPGQGLPSVIDAGEVPADSGEDPLEEPNQVAGPELGHDGQAARATETLEAAAFRGIRPGVSTEAELLASWGPPKTTNSGEGIAEHSYQIAPFARVDVTVESQLVVSLAIHLGTQIEPELVAGQLKLNLDRAVTVRDARGDELGLVFPERGVLFSFVPNEDSTRVGLVMLDALSAQPFELRAEENWRQRPQQALSDLKIALDFDPGSARAHQIQARIYLDLGWGEQALAAAEEAVRLAPEKADYQLTRIQALAVADRPADASKVLEELLENKDLEPVVRGAALVLRGDLAAAAAKRDYQQALFWHTQAIKVLDPVGLDERVDVRRQAKEWLLQAHLAVAADIAWGRWRDKARVVPKWIERAEAFAIDLIEQERGDPKWRIRVDRGAVAAAVGVQGDMGVKTWAENALERCRHLSAESADPLRREQLAWQAAGLLYDALQVEHARGNASEAISYGEKAVEFLEGMESPVRPDGYEHLLGRTYFRLGAVYAVHKNAHARAVALYEKAIPILERAGRAVDFPDTAQQGEDWVSMGVSYWERGDRERAVELTRRGVKQLEAAVGTKQIESEALAIPYGNLATMLEELGRRQEAREFAELADRSQGAVRR